MPRTLQKSAAARMVNSGSRVHHEGAKAAKKPTAKKISPRGEFGPGLPGRSEFGYTFDQHAAFMVGGNIEDLRCTAARCTNLRLLLSAHHLAYGQKLKCAILLRRIRQLQKENDAHDRANPRSDHGGSKSDVPVSYQDRSGCGRVPPEQIQRLVAAQPLEADRALQGSAGRVRRRTGRDDRPGRSRAAKGADQRADANRRKDRYE